MVRGAQIPTTEPPKRAFFVCVSPRPQKNRYGQKAKYGKRGKWGRREHLVILRLGFGSLSSFLALCAGGILRALGVWRGHTTVLVEGVVYEIRNPRDVIEKTLLEGRAWSPDIVRLLAARMRPNAHFVNVGAHIGTVCIPLAKVAAHVTAFEPFPKTFDHLKRNVELNALTNVSLYNAALGDKHERVFFLSDSSERIKENSGRYARPHRRRPEIRRAQRGPGARRRHRRVVRHARQHGPPADRRDARRRRGYGGQASGWCAYDATARPAALAHRDMGGTRSARRRT